MAYDFQTKRKNVLTNTVHTKALCGNLVNDNPIPAWTAVKDNPFITMKDKYEGESIGFNTYYLARGVLLLGAAGTGKTNVNMMFVSKGMIFAMLLRLKICAI